MTMILNRIISEIIEWKHSNNRFLILSFIISGVLVVASLTTTHSTQREYRTIDWCGVEAHVTKVFVQNASIYIYCVS